MIKLDPSFQMNKKTLYYIFFLIILGGIVNHGINKYTCANQNETKLVFQGSFPDEGDLNVYAIPKGEVHYDFTNLYHWSESSKDIWEIKLDNSTHKVKIFFNNFDSIPKNSIQFILQKEGPKDLNQWDLNGIDEVGDFWIANTEHAFLESKELLYYQKWWFMMAGALTLILGTIIFWKAFHSLEMQQVNITIYDILNLSLITAIFLPHPINNIVFIMVLLTSIVTLKQFRLKWNYIDVLTLLFFFYLLINDLVFNQNLNHSDTNFDLYILILLLWFYSKTLKNLNFLQKGNYIVFLYFIWMLSASIFDFLMNPSINQFSFNELSEGIHPVYFSYFVVINLIIYLYQSPKINWILLSAYFIILLLLGSKLCIIFTLFLVVGRLKKLMLPIGIVIICTFMLFKPIRQRFLNVLNINDISILKEDKIKNANDARLNGLTLRVLLWQASVHVPQNNTEMFFGVPSNADVDKRLKSNVILKGLSNHSDFSSHNEYLRLYMEMGLLGVLLFLILFGYILFKAFKNKNSILIAIMALFFITMIFESHQHRVIGTYLFLFYIFSLAAFNSLESKKLESKIAP